MKAANSHLKPNPVFWEGFFVCSGILVTAAWLVLFVGGLHINSSYYRTAIIYGYADLSDWIIAIFTFTLSNVAILAFLAGLLGGIISKVRVTEGFSKAIAELEDPNISSILYENPFISAFRGVFIFIAILSIQYFSSFSDLNSIASQAPEQVSKETIRDQQTYTNLLAAVNDSASKELIKEFWEKEQMVQRDLNMDSIAMNIRAFKDSISFLKKQKADCTVLANKVIALRGLIKAPPGSDLTGISASSYFKFAVVVSLLSFICGYDPGRFAQFLSNFPLFKRTGK